MMLLGFVLRRSQTVLSRSVYTNLIRAAANTHILSNNQP
jgi:hypothetical protein